MNFRKTLASALACLVACSALPFSACNGGDTGDTDDGLILSYSFDESTGNTTVEGVSKTNQKIEYVFNEENLTFLA